MKEEIFGPILPVVTVESAYEAIGFINSRYDDLNISAENLNISVQINVKEGKNLQNWKYSIFMYVFKFIRFVLLLFFFSFCFPGQNHCLCIYFHPIKKYENYS